MGLRLTMLILKAKLLGHGHGVFILNDRRKRKGYVAVSVSLFEVFIEFTMHSFLQDNIKGFPRDAHG